jgi:hypothetical protein
VWLWSLVLVYSGIVRKVSTMPWELRLAVRVQGDDEGKRAPWTSVLVLLGCLALINVQVPLILVGPYGPISSGAAITFVVAQLLWLARIRRAVRRTEQP